MASQQINKASKVKKTHKTDFEYKFLYFLRQDIEHTGKIIRYTIQRACYLMDYILPFTPIIF